MSHEICAHVGEGETPAWLDFVAATHEVDLRSFSVMSVVALRRVIRQGGFDVVHAHGRGAALYEFAVSLTLIPRVRRYSTVYTFHGFSPERAGRFRILYLALERLFARHFDRRVVLTPSECHNVERHVGDPACNLTVIPNGIARPECNDTVRIRGCSRKDRNLVTIGRICAQKDFVTMLQSVALANMDPGDPITLHVIGGVSRPDEKYARRIHALRNSLGLRGLVYFYGAKSSASDGLCHFDTFLSTSIWEGLPTAVIEAGMSGLPIVATDCQGNIDVVEHGTNGYVCTTKDPASVASGIRRMVHSDQLLMGQAAQKLFRSRYSVKKYVANMMALYESITGIDD